MNDTFLKSAIIVARPLAIFTLFVVLWGSSIKGGYILDGADYILGRDFVNMWHYGISAFFDDPARYYNIDTYNAALDDLIAGHDYKNQQFSYPPHFMLLAAPFGKMPYNLAFLTFTTLNLGLFWKFALSPFDKAAKNILIWAPAFALALLCGQLSLLLVVVFAAILRTMDERPLIAGLLIALLTIKPQIGFLFPIFLLATGRYKVFLYAGLFSIMLFLASITIHGFEVWNVYFTSAAGSQAETMIDSHPIVLGLMPTLYVNLAMLGLSPNLAFIIHGLAALIGIIAMVITIRRVESLKIKYAIFIATSFAATPYLMAYDTLLLVWAAMLFATSFKYDRMDKISLCLVIALPVLGVTMALSGLTGYTIAIWLLLYLMIRQAWKSQSEAQTLA